VVLGITGEPALSESFISPGPHIVPGCYGALASLPSSGAALDWLRRQIADASYDEINRQAAGRISACRDLFFYPHLAGAAFPDWDNGARAAFTGLCMDSDRYDMALACMEGVAFEMRRALDAFADSRIPLGSLKVMGGATRSPLWLSIISALWAGPIQVMAVRDTACVGAAALAGVGVGLYEDYRSAVQGTGSTTPSG
jgi:xylulokinase